MAKPLKSWYVSVMKSPCKQIESIKCVSADEATAKLKQLKEKYVDEPATETSPAVTYTFYREQY